MEGGVYLRDLRPGSELAVKTRNHLYKVLILGDETALISGHPTFCPEPAEVRIVGSTWGGSMLKPKFLGFGMHLEFEHPVHRKVLTSRIEEIREAA